MKALTKIKQAVQKEVSGYSETKKRKLIVLLMVAFFMLIVLNSCIAYQKIFRPKESVSNWEVQAIERLNLSDEKEITHQEMMENLNQMKNDIQKTSLITSLITNLITSLKTIQRN
jgi:hypothetical protein